MLGALEKFLMAMKGMPPGEVAALLGQKAGAAGKAGMELAGQYPKTAAFGGGLGAGAMLSGGGEQEPDQDDEELQLMARRLGHASPY